MNSIIDVSTPEQHAQRLLENTREQLQQLRRRPLRQPERPRQQRVQRRLPRWQVLGGGRGVLHGVRPGPVPNGNWQGRVRCMRRGHEGRRARPISRRVLHGLHSGPVLGGGRDVLHGVRRGHGVHH